MANILAADHVAPPDALSLLSSAMQAQNTPNEKAKLHQLLALFHAQPGNITPLFPTLVSMLGQTNDTFKDFIVDVIDLTFCKPTIGPQARSSLAYHMPDALLTMLNEEDTRHAKVAISAFASVYQALFRLVCTDRTQTRLWPKIEAIKQRILQLFDLPQHMGVKLAAVKAFQKIILVQTRPVDARGQVISRSAADANVSQIPSDHPVLRSAPLEQEGNERIKQIVYIIFTSPSADLVMASMNIMAALAKLRLSLSAIVFEALTSWTPSALAGLPYVTIRSVEKTLRLLFQHFHPSRNSLAGPYASQIIEAVDNQKLRMEMAARENEAQRKELASQKRSAVEESASIVATDRKRSRQDQESIAQTASIEESGDAAASRIGPSYATGPSSAAGPGNAMLLATSDPSDPNPMAAFDATSLPLPLVVELVMANLAAMSEADLQNAVEQARARVHGRAPPPPTNGADLNRPGPAPGPPPTHPGPPPQHLLKTEDSAMDDQDADGGVAQDPLKLDMGEEETLSAAERHLQETAAHDGQGESAVGMANFTLRPPEDLSAEDCKAMLHASVDRICHVGLREGGGSMAENSKGLSSAVATGQGGKELHAPHGQLWTVLVTRLATRGFGNFDVANEDENASDSRVALQLQSDAVRQLMLRFVVDDFPARSEIALQWIAEEFHCHLLFRKQGRLSADGESSYTVWLQRIVAAVIEQMDAKDKTLHEFLNRVPLLTDSIISTVQTLCLDRAKLSAGFTILRDLAIHRTPARPITCGILLDLTRNVEKMVRNAAIITVRLWVRVNGHGNSPVGEGIEKDILEYAKAGLKRLSVRDPTPTESPKDEKAELPNGKQPSATAEEVKQEDAGQEEEGMAVDATAEKSVLDDPLAEVHLDSDVERLVQLPFALCVRVSDMLEEVFAAYIDMPTQVRQSVERHITPLVQNLGPNNGKLLSLIKNHPLECDALAVHIFRVVSEKHRSKKMVDVVKQMAEERSSDIDPRFLIPILPDLEKAEIVKYLPRVVSILSSEKADDRTMLKNVFTSVVQPPEQGFGSVSTNLPRVRQSELLTSVELMSLLHHAEPEIGRKTAADAIRICFGMPDIFRSEVIGAVLNKLIEEPELPVLFMRTAIMAVRTYKSLSSYISTIFLSRLITKKVWQQPLLWDGFVICAKQTAPASYGALVMLPRDQLRDVVSRQPDLRVGLREYLIKKAGGNKARLKSFMELLGDDEDDGAAAAAAAAPAPATATGTPGSGTSTPTQVASTAEGQ